MTWMPYWKRWGTRRRWLLLFSITASWEKVHRSGFRHRDFENGVVKIQNGEEKDLTITEKHAVRCLFVSELNQSDPEKLNVANRMGERLAKKRRTTDTSGNYIDCSFIIGSAAKVERLWRIGNYVLASHRPSMTPQSIWSHPFSSWEQAFLGREVGSESNRNGTYRTFESKNGWSSRACNELKPGVDKVLIVKW